MGRTSRVVWIVGLAVVVALSGCGVVGDESGSACIDDMIERLPGDVALVYGSDLDAARAAGYDDSTPESAVQAVTEFGVWPDPSTQTAVFRFRAEPSDDTPYDPSDVECWAGDPGGGWIARGDFDPDRVARAGDGLFTSDDGSLVTDDEALLADGDPPSRLLTLMDSFDPVVVSFSATRPPDQEQWTGAALVDADGVWALDVRWVRWNEQEAEAAEDVIVEVIENDSELDELIVEDAVQALERDGEVLSVSGELTAGPASWAPFLLRSDPILDIGHTQE